MRMGSKLSFCAGLLALAASASTRSKRPGPDSRWRQLTSEHFVVETDLPPEDAGAVLGQLELTHALTVKALAVPVRAPRLHVAVFATRQEFQLYVQNGEQISGTFVIDGSGLPHLVLCGDAGSELVRTLRHQV